MLDIPHEPYNCLNSYFMLTFIVNDFCYMPFLEIKLEGKVVWIHATLLLAYNSALATPQYGK